MPELADFHFLRPWWLLAVLPALLLWLLVGVRGNAERRWRRVVAPHLLAHLRVGTGEGWRFRPLHLIVSVLVLLALGLAGPTWEREVSPFAEDTAPLVLVLDVSASMNATDVQPTRLERAKQKARDLLALRGGAKSALVAYAGSAHLVLPLCDDPSVFDTFLAALKTDVLPVRGKDPAAALARAEELLADEPAPGSILFLTDGIAAEHAAAFAEHRQRSADEVLVLAVGTREGGPVPLDVLGLEALESEAGAFVAGVTVDDADVRRIERRVQSHLREVLSQDGTARWKDQGYWLTFPVALLALLWFRRGWTIRWAAVALVLSGCSPDLWWTADQQGRRHFERGDYAAAAERFDDPLWKGAAHYKFGDYEQAADAFSRRATAGVGRASGAAEASFNLGNAYAMLGRYEEAVTAYEAALAEHPEWSEAIDNRDAVAALLQREPEMPEEEQAAGDPSFDPDEIQFDEKGKKGKAGEIERSQLTDEQLAEMWLRRLETSPADFLRQRFAVEAAAEAPPRSPQGDAAEEQP